MILSKEHILASAFACELAFIVCIASGLNALPFVVFEVCTLLFLPGLLTLLFLRLRFDNIWGYITVIVGFSVLELLIAGFAGNMVLPLFGITKPLERIPLLEQYTFTGVLIGLCWARIEQVQIPIRRFLVFDTWRDLLLSIAPALLVVLTVLGAVQLNDGGSGAVTVCMLVCLAGYAAVLLWKSDNLEKSVIPTGLFFMSLSLLLMTSLRGWYITGHDIQREFGVFEMTKANGIWNISAYRDAYNACLSITILPTVFSKLLAIPDQYIYKVLFQLIFATMPVMLFLMLRRFVTPRFALIATLYFVAFPTFFGDMTFLNRQEIAFVFLGLMFYVVYEELLPVIMRRVLFLVFGFGMVLSHYTTTYTIVAALIFLVTLRPLVLRAGQWLSQYRLFSRSAFALHQKRIRPTITVWMVVVLMAASFFWSSILTQTASESIYRVFTETLAVMNHTVREESQSSDVNYGLFSSHSVSLNDLYAQYQTQIVAKTRAEDPSAYYSDAAYAQYPAPLIQNPDMPLTVAGKLLQSTGIDVYSFNDWVRQGSAKLLQLLIVIGMIAAVFSAEFTVAKFDAEFALLAAAGLLFVAAQVVLPVLSVEYGVLRAFQQSIFFLGVFISLGSAAILFGASTRIKQAVASGLVVAFLLSSTGVFTQLLGGYGAQLHLNNSGSYYEQYYLHTSDILAANWLKNHKTYANPIQTNLLLVFRFGLDSSQSEDFYPGLIRKDSYVLLGYPNVTAQRATLQYESSELTYAYPLEFLDENKDLIYNSGASRIYR